MKTLKLLALLAGFVVFALPVISRAVDATYNNLEVTGTADFQYNSMMFGSTSGTYPQPGISFSFTDISGTNPAVFEMRQP